MEGGRYSAPTDPRGAVGVTSPPLPPSPTRGEGGMVPVSGGRSSAPVDPLAGIGLWRAEGLPPLPIRGARWVSPLPPFPQGERG